jgi:PAS domain S-box-containing protein
LKDNRNGLSESPSADGLRVSNECSAAVEAARNDYEELFHSVAESATDAIISIDSRGNVLYWNRSAEKTFGFSAKETIGKPLTLIMPQCFQEAHQNGLEQLVSTGKSKIIGKVVEVAGLRKNGEEFPIELSLSTWRRNNDIFFTGIIRDITERKQVEEALRKAKDELEIRVEERTIELRNVNKRLLIGLKERRRAEEALEKSLKSLRKALEGTVNALATTAEKKDPYTAGHQRRVAQLACAIGEAMGLSEEYIEGLRIAGSLHDIGKIVVPAEILSKPGRLNEYEFGIIKPHPQIGYEILKGIEFPWPVSQAVLQHHEKLDGSGYPEGLSGEEIILEARILTVADVVEAIASHRPYRPSLGIENALDEIKKNCGILYDSYVVDTCLSLFNEKGFYFS